jgi:hypothetical protein
MCLADQLFQTGVNIHDDQNMRPSLSHGSQSGPEEAIGAVQGRSRAFAFERGDLLPRGEDFNRRLETTAKDAKRADECVDEIEHEATVVTLCNASTGPAVQTQFTDFRASSAFDYRQVDWQQPLERECPALRFGGVKIESGGERHAFEVQVLLNDLDPNAARE